jgi:hypothetical protein
MESIAIIINYYQKLTYYLLENTLTLSPKMQVVETRRFGDVKARVFTREKGQIRDAVNEHDGQVT